MADDLLGVGEIRRLKSRFTAAAGRGSGSGQKDSFDLGLPFADQDECTKFQIFPLLSYSRMPPLAPPSVADIIFSGGKSEG